MSEVKRTLTGENGHLYNLEKEIGSGGEGIVYQTDDPSIAVKIYKNPSPEIERKIRYMVSCPIDSRAKDAARTPVIAWPQDTLYENGKFVGYAMPLATDTIPIYTLCRGGEKARSFFKNYSWLTHLGVAFNLANTVKYLHSMDCIVGDMNSKNIVVHRNGFITFLDVDSFDLTNSVTGEHFPCTVGRPEFLPPELQGRDLRNACFTIHSDEFSLAVHIFRLLLHNRHPFDVKITNIGRESVNESKQEYNISVGNCAYVRTVPGCEVPPNEPTLDMLPSNLQEDFRNTFNYDNSDVMQKVSRRTTAAQWAADLGGLYKDRMSLLEQCTQDPEHYFLKSKGFCEFCRVMPPKAKPNTATWMIEFGGCNLSENSVGDLKSSVSAASPWYFHATVKDGPKDQTIDVYYQIFYPDGTNTTRQILVPQAKPGDALTVKCDSVIDGASSEIGGLCKVILSDAGGNTLAETSVTVSPDKKRPKPLRKPSTLKWKPILFAGMWILSLVIVFAVMQSTNDELSYTNRSLRREVSSLEDEVSSLEDEISSLESENENLEAKNDELEARNDNFEAANQELEEIYASYKKIVDFMDYNVRVVSLADGKNIYHRYGCPKFVERDFYVYNTNLMKSKDYAPCTDCCSDD